MDEQDQKPDDGFIIKETHSLKEAIEELRNLSKNAQSKVRIVYDLDLLNTLVVLICGIGLILSILYAKETMATTIGAGLLGYLSKNTNKQP